MTNFWTKLRLWTKVVIFTVIAIYGIFFIIANWELSVKGKLRFIFTEFDEPKVLVVLLMTAVLTLVAWWLFRMVFRTLRQFREMGERNRIARREKEFADMKAKMDMLRVKDTASTPESPAADSPKA